VIEMDADVPVTAKTDLNQLILDLEKAAFYEHTRLAEIRPDVELELTLIGQYSKLADHIDVHRWYQGEQQKQDISYAEALNSWIDTVYLPLVDIIRKKNILKDFPGRTETDLYLWIIEHHWFLAGIGHDEVSMEDAALNYRKKYSQKPVRRVFNFLKKAARAVTSGVESTLDPLDSEPSPNHERPESPDLKPPE